MIKWLKSLFEKKEPLPFNTDEDRYLGVIQYIGPTKKVSMGEELGIFTLKGEGVFLDTVNVKEFFPYDLKGMFKYSRERLRAIREGKNES